MREKNQRRMLFVSHFPTHSTAWELLEFIGTQKAYEDEFIQRGDAFRDAKGTAWLISCYWMATEELAERWANDNGLSLYQTTEVVTITTR